MVDNIDKAEMARGLRFRTCNSCRRVKPTGEYYDTHGRCKVCVREISRNRYAAKIADRPKKEPKRARTYSAEQLAEWANRDYKRRMGITFEERDAMLEAQGGVCAICRSPEPFGNGWCTDHDHSCCDSKSKSCGECIRGILCRKCNLALGHAQDSIDILRAAIKYLEDWERRGQD